MSKLLYAVAAQWLDKIFPTDIRERIACASPVIPAPTPANVGKDFILSHVPEAEILITSWGTPEIDADIWAAAPNLKLVTHAAGSVKQLISADAWRQGIRVSSAAHAIGVGVAEFCLGLMLTVPKRVYWLTQQTRQGFWRETLDSFGPFFEIYRQNVGIIGASHVGRHLIELLKSFGCNTLVYDRYCSAEDARRLGATKVDNLDDLFSRCRIVSLNAPATEETQGMIRGSHFALLPPGSVFINTARAVVINTEEMVAELRKGEFIACLDVTAPEPPLADDELRRLPNVLLTPHIAGGVSENLMRIGEFVAEEIAAYVEGRPLQGEVMQDRLDRMA